MTSPSTLRAVAAAAGVHPSTASRALNPATRHLVAAAAAARVLEAAAALDYRPDVAAAGLRTGRSRLVGALVPGIANPVFAPILAGAAAALAEAGHALLVADAGDDPQRAAELARQLAAHRVDGLLVATAARADDPALAAAAARGLPVVLVNRSAGAGVAAIVSDDAAGLRLAVAHLVGLGHRRIGHLAGPAWLSTGHLRRTGFCEAIAEYGFDPSAVVEAPAYTRDAGAGAARALLAAHPDLTAIACANDLLALGAYDVCRATGRAIPAGLSITGHNDMPLVDMVDPPLTTVRIAHEAMGRRAAAALLAALAGDVAPERVLLAPLLVVRGSTAAVSRPAAATPTLPAAPPSPD